MPVCWAHWWAAAVVIRFQEPSDIRSWGLDLNTRDESPPIGWDGKVVDVYPAAGRFAVTIRNGEGSETRVWWSPEGGVDGLEDQPGVAVHAVEIDRAIRRTWLEDGDSPYPARERLGGSRILPPGTAASEQGLVMSVRRLVTSGVADVLIKGSDLVVPFLWRYKQRPSSIIREVASLGVATEESVRDRLPGLFKAVADMETRHRGVVVIPRGTQDHPVDRIDPSLVVPGWSGLALSVDSDAPNLIYGAAKTGKTWITIALSVALADWHPLVIATEGLFVWRRRLNETFRRDCHPLLIGGASVDPEEIARLAKEADKYGTGVVVVDVLRPFLSRIGTSENDSQAIDAVLAHLRPVTEGRVVVLVHHEGKDGERGPRGSSALIDVAGAVFQVEESLNGGLAMLTPKLWRNGPLDDQPTLSIHLGSRGSLQVRRCGEGDRHAQHNRCTEILHAMREIGAPASLRDIRARVKGLKGEKPTIADLQYLAAVDKVHSHRGYNNHALWVLDSPSGCCEATPGS